MSAVIERRVIGGLLPAIAILVLFVASGGGALLWAILATWSCGFALGCAYLCGSLAWPRAPAAIGGLALVAAAVIVAIAREDTLSLLIEPLQRLGNRARWTMSPVSVIGQCGLAGLLRSGWRGVPCGRLAGHS
jgi:hypothetical protein